MTDATDTPEASLIQQRISLERRRLIALVLMIVFLLLVGGQLVLMAYEGWRWYVIAPLVVLGALVLQFVGAHRALRDFEHENGRDAGRQRPAGR